VDDPREQSGYDWLSAICNRTGLEAKTQKLLAVLDFRKSSKSCKRGLLPGPLSAKRCNSTGSEADGTYLNKLNSEKI